MKTKIAFLGIMASVLATVACQREPQSEINPTYDPVANTVNTQFVVNVSTGTGTPQTKQTAQDVQYSASDFRGMTAAHILTYQLGYSGVGGAKYLYKAEDASSVATTDYDKGTLIDKDDVNAEDQRRIIELALPIGTNAILVYGRAPKTSTSDAQGSVTASGTALNSSLTNVSFTLDNRLSDPEAFSQACLLFGRILTGIMNSGRVVESSGMGYKVPEGTTPKDNTYAFWWPIDEESKVWNNDEAACRNAEGNEHAGYTLHKGSIRWKDYGDMYKDNPEQLNAMEKILGSSYSEVMGLKKDGSKTELRAGASVTLCRLVKDMYNVVSRVRNAEATDPEEYIAKLVANEIVKRAGYFFEYDPGQIMNFKPWPDIASSVDYLIPDVVVSKDFSKINESFFHHEKYGDADTRDNNAGFPQNLGMPIGSAVMTFMAVPPQETDPKKQFIVISYPEDIPAYGLGTETFSVKNYRYPAELMYYTNSSIRTTANPVDKNASTGFPKLSYNWTKDDLWNAQIWNKSVVEVSTAGVAVAKTINYGTALLQSQFAYASNTIEDNNQQLHPTEKNNVIDVSSKPNQFKVTGIMIGGVNDTVGWNFIPKSSGSFDKMIYDNLGTSSFYIPQYVNGPVSSAPVYTCTWDNYNHLAVDKQSKVYIGLELVNNTGQDIWGELNLIRNGGTFYLIAELDPYAEGVAVNLPKTVVDGKEVIDLSRSDCFYPPFNEADGTTISAPRVFMQDYITSVLFKFSKTSLQHAYVTMPDLRAGQISLGMSVDLKWQPGLSFEAIMGGN